MNASKSHFIFITILLLSITEYASAQQEVVIDNVTNSADGQFLFAGRTHVMSIRFTNFGPPECIDFRYNTNNGFRLISPTGATWNHTIVTMTDAFRDLGWLSFLFHYEDPFGDTVSQGDGIPVDYFVLQGFNALGEFPHGFDDIVMEVEIETNIADTNLNICLEKHEVGKLNTFAWAAIFGAQCNVVPSIERRRCYTIIDGCCVGRRGNIDLDPNGTVDIADLTFFIDHMFINFPPLPCRDQANVNGDPDDRVDIADLTLFLDHLFRDFTALAFCP